MSNRFFSVHAQRRHAPHWMEILERRELMAYSVLTYHNDPASTGQNLSETVLSPQNVNAGQFGKLHSTPLDGQVYAQPLVVAHVNVTTGASPGIHDVVIAATEHDSVYAIDAANGDVLWHDSFIDPAAGITTLSSADVLSESISPEIGITSTPVVDPTTGTVYVEARTKEVRGGQTHFVHSLHALDLQNGAETLGGPLVLGDTILRAEGSYDYVSGPEVSGGGDGATGGVVPFNAVREHQRTALSLVNGVVYLGFASLGDNGPYHGWILGVDAKSLKLVAAFNATPNGTAGGIWQSGAGITADEQGDLYAVTGNGTFDTALDAGGFPIHGNYGDSILKLAVDPASTPDHPNVNGWGLKVVDYFTPSNQQALSDVDADLGSGGVLLLPDSAGSAAHRRLLVAADKGGSIYVLDRDGLGGFDPSADHVLQEFTEMPHGAYDVPAYYNGAVYYAGAADPVKRFTVSGGAMSVIPDSVSTESIGWGGSTISISAGDAAGIAWAVDPGADQLLAFDAAHLADRLYSSIDAPGGRDALGTAVKFSLPTVANGRVYAGTANSLVIYGLLTAAGASAPRDGQLATVQGVEGLPVGGGALATFSAGAGAEAAGDFHAAIDWGDGSFSSGTVTANGDSYQVSGVHVYLDEGAWPVKITISNPAGALLLQGEAQIVESLLPDGARGSADDRFLSELYADLLGRPIDLEGLNYWRGVLQMSSSRGLVAAALEDANEFREVEVQRLFRRYLGRTAEPAAASYFARALADGETETQIATSLLASTEYFQTRGAGVDSRFLNAIYRDALGRGLDDAGRTFWTQALHAGLPRTELVRLMLDGDEFRRRIVGQLYGELLDRPADPAGEAAFAAWLAAGGRREHVAAALAASDEFFAKTAD
ncbi:MAG TPA: DUF4214 domain-containing protein [Pirellulales bacterium]|nr:DUF4214 domain-containing protein [Pirellulales bacterium]